MAAVSWALAYAYRTLLETVGQQTEAGGKGYKSTATLVTQSAANTPVMKPAAKLEPEPELAAKADSEATILDGTEARHLGSLSHDPVTDQEMMREASPCSLWVWVLVSVAERYLCADDLYMQQTPWKTKEQGIQCLREMAVAEMVFSDDISTRKLDLVSCTSVMWRKLIRLGPLEYASALAVMKWEDMEETVLDMAKKLRAYADAVHGPTHARIAAVETRLQKLEDKIDENHKKLREEIGEDLLQISAVQIRAECRPQFAFTWRGVQYTWNRLPQGWKHSPTICHGLIQTALENDKAPEHLQYIDDIIVWGNTAAEVFEKGKEIIQILLEAGFAIKKSKVKGPAREIQVLGVKWQDGRWQIPTDVINKITAMSPPTNKKETKAFLGAIGFWRMHIPEYSQIVSPLYLVTRKKNDFHWGPEQQQAFAQIKQEIAHAVALGPVRTGPDVKNVLYSAAGSHGLSWSFWQKVPGETRGRPLGFWSRSYRGSEANYTPTEKEILASYEGVQAASEVIARWAHDASGHQGRDAIYKWARDRGVDLTLDSISQVIHNCETCAAIKQAKRVKPLWHGGWRSKYKYREAWQIDYIALPQTRHSKRYVLTMVEATTGWLETYPVPHATAWNTIRGLEKQVLWRHGIPERTESDKGTHFKNSLIKHLG
ncbi:hypothetical protein DUI87_04925 [Hirundo rustica rustica]|uniref:ribonuclease H n=1 Tax=Hirundo rustica rustica TaxID=333673 RepID=A0A3M0LG13_HIRRU|nr:hypothetical protein DUI87_04925 [Hirundo rustica rustica]